MERLTEKTVTGGYDIKKQQLLNAPYKLGQLEDIEEELGIDLIVLFKAENKCFCKIDSSVYEGYINEIYLTNKQIGFVSEDTDLFELFIKDYGKTWALTIKELL